MREWKSLYLLIRDTLVNIIYVIYCRERKMVYKAENKLRQSYIVKYILT